MRLDRRTAYALAMVSPLLLGAVGALALLLAGGVPGGGGVAPAAATARAAVPYAATSSAPGSAPQFVPESPDRILDTRAGGQPISGAGGTLQPNTVYTVDLSKTDVSSSAGALALNVTAIAPSTVGNLRVAPSCSSTAPATSLINYEPGSDTANYLVVPLQCSATSAPVEALTIYSANAAVDVTLDITGYYPIAQPTSTTSSTTSADPIGSVLSSILPAAATTTTAAATTTTSATASTTSAGSVTTPGFTAVTPYRAADTRTGTGSTQAPIAAGTSRAFQIGGSTVPTGAAAVALNVTSIAPAGAGNLRVYPDGGSVPTASNVNYIPGVDKAGFVVVQLPANGQIDVYAAGQPDDVVIDVFGYYPSTSTLVTSAPARILDTRTSGTAQGLPSPLATGTSYAVQVTGNAGVPAGATAVLVSLTAADPRTGTGNLRAFPGGGSVPNASNINYVGPAVDVANFAIVPLSSTGTISLYTAGSTADAIVDVLGYVPGTGSSSSSSGSSSSSSTSSSSSATSTSATSTSATTTSTTTSMSTSVSASTTCILPSNPITGCL